MQAVVQTRYGGPEVLEVQERPEPRPGERDVMIAVRAAGVNFVLSWWKADGHLDRIIQPLLADLEAGRLEPVVSEAFAFSRADDAHRFLAERRNIGKVLLVPD